LAGAGVCQIKDHLDRCAIAADTSIDYEAYYTLIDICIRIARAEGQHPDVGVAIQLISQLHCQSDAPEIEFRIV
jgi:hypothetical protein